MISANKTKFLSLAALAVAVLATVAVSRTVQLPAPAQAITDSAATGAAAGPASPSRGLLICGMALDEDCARVEQQLPM